MPDATELRRRLDDLRAIRAGGARNVRHRNGDEERETAFMTEAELSRAIAATESELAAVEGRRSPTTIRFTTSKEL